MPANRTSLLAGVFLALALSGCSTTYRVMRVPSDEKNASIYRECQRTANMSRPPRDSDAGTYQNRYAETLESCLKTSSWWSLHTYHNKVPQFEQCRQLDRVKVADPSGSREFFVYACKGGLKDNK